MHGRMHRGVFVCSLLLFMGGCGIIVRKPAPSPVEPPQEIHTTFFDSVAVFTIGPPDSLALPDTQADRNPPRANGGRRRGSDRTRQPSIAESTATTPGGPAELPSVSVALPEEERMQLRNAALADITQADIVLSGLSRRSLTQEEKRSVDTIRGLMDQARDALVKEDIQAAADLARKARLLADKLPTPR